MITSLILAGSLLMAPAGTTHAGGPTRNWKSVGLGHRAKHVTHHAKILRLKKTTWYLTTPIGGCLDKGRMCSGLVEKLNDQMFRNGQEFRWISTRPRPVPAYQLKEFAKRKQAYGLVGD